MKKYCIVAALIVTLALVVTTLYIVETTSVTYYHGFYLLLALLNTVILYIVATTKERDEQQDYTALEQIAFRDALTSLLNRRAVDNFIDKIIARSERDGSKFAILYLDMDNFKPINDTLGHDVGDNVLLGVAKRLRNLVRGNDVVGRVGGDEFVIILDEINESSLAFITAERVIQSFKKPLNVDGHRISVSFSIGISIYPDNGVYRLSLFKAADIAMYQAKENGKNGYKFYTNELDDKVKKSRTMNIALEQALAEEQFVLLYQPRINFNNNHIQKAEALIRWKRPDSGLVAPSEFIPHAEKSHLILSIGAWVINEACRQCRIFCDRNEPTQISINISLIQLKDPDFVATLKQAIDAHGIDAALIELEMSESYLMQEVEEIIPVLHKLRAVGVKLAIDAFGKGYSSMGYMKRLPIDTIKIDRSLINEILINQKDKELVAAITALGHVMNMSVVAEGVEIDKHLEMSKKLHIDAAQGFYVAEPLEADALYDFYKERDEKIS